MVGDDRADRAAHPRMRGEHTVAFVGALTCPGSSPHARGAHPAFRSAGSDRGLIPACAGSTVTSSRGDGAQAAHPRMRGEHSIPGSDLQTSLGSSPHARGARRGGGIVGVLRRLIPACAGSTLPDMGRFQPRTRFSFSSRDSGPAVRSMLHRALGLHATRQPSSPPLWLGGGLRRRSAAEADQALPTRFICWVQNAPVVITSVPSQASSPVRPGMSEPLKVGSSPRRRWAS